MQWFALIITLFVALSMTADIDFYSGKDINLRNSQPFVVILLINAFQCTSLSPLLIFIFLY